MQILNEPVKPVDRYPWDEWLDGEPRRIHQGVDFEIDPRRMAMSIRSAAKNRNLKVAVRERTALKAVDFQVIP